MKMEMIVWLITKLCAENRVTGAEMSAGGQVFEKRSAATNVDLL